MKRLLLMLVVWSGCACASTYYVSSSVGNDSYTAVQAQSPATPWKSLTKVSGTTFVAGDRILLARGDVWRETLTPSSSGSSGNPIVFDAYGSGAAPEITGYQAVTGWTSVAGYTNQWKATLTTTALNFVLFGTIWGTKQSSQGALAHDRDFYLNSNTVYVFAPSDPTSYYGSVAGMLVTNLPLISVNGKSWLTFQHIKLDWFDQYGVYVAGAADHLVFANMEVDGMIPAGALPLGFYVNGTSSTDVQFINAEAHMNYDGFRFDGTVGSPGGAIVNAKAYFNRNYGINNTTAGTVTYSNSHLYGNGIAVLTSTDAHGAVDGGGNLAANTAPAVNNFARYPARITYTIDDEGKSLGGADYIDSLLPQFASRNLKLSVAVVTGEQYAAADVPRIQGWFNAGHDINSHSWSHNYYDGPTMFTLKYTGTGTAAAMTISGNLLTTTVTGGPGGENLSFDLTNTSYSDYTKLVSAINGRSGYSATLLGLPHGHTVTLANVSAVDIKSANYNVQLDPTKFVPDEMSTSKSWLLANVSGLSSAELVYVYPSGKENYQTQLYAAAAGYKGGRGSLSMGGAVAGTFPTNSGPAPLESNVRSVYGYGVNLQNITSLGASGFASQTAAQIAAQVASLANKAKAWGVPYGLFTHPPELGATPPAPELTVTEIGAVLDGLVAAGATVMTNTQLVDFLASQSPVTGSTLYVAAGASSGVDLRETASSATVLQGSNQGATYRVDMAGALRPLNGAWDIGAYQTLWAKHGSRSGTGHFTFGGGAAVKGENAYCSPGDVAGFGSVDGPATLPQQCVYTAMAGTPSPGPVTTVAVDCSNLQAVLNAAVAGDTVVVPAAAVCTGTYTFPAKTGADRNHWITVRSSAVSDPNFPGEGVQATPCQIGLTHIDGYPDYACGAPAKRMPTISSATTNATPVTIAGNFYRLIGIEVTKNYGVSMGQELVDLQGSDHVILDRCLIHGDNWDLHTPNRDTHIGVVTKGTYQAILNSWIYDVDWGPAEGYAIGGGSGGQADEGPIKVYNNLVAAGSESWLIGGGAAAAWPHDYEFRRNLSMKPLKWFQAFGAASSGVSVNVKNLGEYKHGHRILYEENVFTNNWSGQADQDGWALVLLPKNQSYFENPGSKRINVSGTSVSCASDAAGTPCAAGAGIYGNAITSLSRTNGMVTLNGANNGIGWPHFNSGGKIVLQGIPSQVVNGVNLNSFNGEWTMGCLNATTCTDGFNYPRVLYFAAPGPDFPLTNTNGGLAQDFTASTCADTGHCRIGPNANYPPYHIASVLDTEHLTTQEAMGDQTGGTQRICHPGLAPSAQVRDFTARHNYIAHATNVGMNLYPADSDCADESLGASYFSIHDNLADDIQSIGWIQGDSVHGGEGTLINNGSATPSVMPHDILYAHNTWAGLRAFTSANYYSAGFELSDMQGSPASYYANVTIRDNIFAGPVKVTSSGGALLASGVAAKFAANLCLSGTCTWTYKNNLVATAPYAAFTNTTSAYNATYPAANPDSSPTCTVSGGCQVADLSGVFTAWGDGLGDTRWNDYTVSANYRGAGSDGRDLGADIAHIRAVKAAVLPTFTYDPLVIATGSPLAACTVNVYCEQQVTISSGASGATGFVQWHLVSGSLPAGLSLATFDKASASDCGPQNGSAPAKNGLTGCAGWIWGTPTGSGTYQFTLQAEDAAHQTATVSLTLTVNDTN